MRAELVSKKNKHDKYYAPQWLVEYAVEKTLENVPMDEITEIMEPAAGNGAFIPYIEDIAEDYNIPAKFFDKFPDKSEPKIKYQNFIKAPIPYKKGRLILTGPPYSRGLWFEFAEKAGKIADYVAFISPYSAMDLPNPSNELEVIFQEDKKGVYFEGSPEHEGTDQVPTKKVNTVFLIFKRIDPIDRYGQIDKDLKIKVFQNNYFYSGEELSQYDFFINKFGFSTGTISRNYYCKKDNGIGFKPCFMNCFGIKILNEDRRKEFYEFFSNFRKFRPEFKKYSAANRYELSQTRFREILKRELY